MNKEDKYSLIQGASILCAIEDRQLSASGCPFKHKAPTVKHLQ